MPSAQLNNHAMYYELHGPPDAPPVLAMGGWGTWCHGDEAQLPRGLTERYRVAIFDHRGIGESSDDPSIPASMKLYAADCAALLDHLGWKQVHVVGLVGMGACIGQELAIARPDLVRSMINSGAWAAVDPYFVDQMRALADSHREVSFWKFQQETVMLSFDRAFYNANRERLLGPNGGWRELRDNFPAHARFTDAVCNHDAIDRLNLIKAPTLVIHGGKDLITPPELSQPIESSIAGAKGVLVADAPHVFAGRTLKARLAELVLGFLDLHSP
jgi:3-oxoadipate enol-lactonase